jgi:hypothetical protein
MKKCLTKLSLFVLLILCNQAIAINYKDRIFKKDSAFTVFRETQIGKNFFNTNNNNYFSYSTKLGMQMYCFQAGISAEREYNFTQANSDNYIQRNKSFGAFFGLELPITNKLDIGIVGTANFYDAYLERPIYIATSNKLFEINYNNIYQAQLRFNYQFNKAFSLLASTNFNFNQINGGNKYIDENNFFRFNVGLRYTAYPDLVINNFKDESNRIKIFAGTQLEWKNEYFNSFLGQTYTFSNEELLKLARTGSETSKAIVYPMLGIISKRNNMLLFGFNQREFTQFSPYYNQGYSDSNWKVGITDRSARMALELNLFSFMGEKMSSKFKSIYPYYRLTTTYTTKSVAVNEGWESLKTVTDSIYIFPKVNNKLQANSVEINNSIGVALKLQKLYLSAGFNVFNRTYGEVKYESSVTNEYYQIYPFQNFIESKTETKPTQETKGWLGKPIDPINVFFTVGLVL